MVLPQINAKISTGRVADIVGSYGLGGRNARGDTMI